MGEFAAAGMFPSEALTGFEIQIAPVGMRPDHQAAQRKVRGQQFSGELQKRTALASNAVEVAWTGGDIDQE
jgi:hypothetical protein